MRKVSLLLSLLFVLLLSSPAWAINVSLTTTIEGGNKPVVVGKTNLPDGMKLSVSMNSNNRVLIRKDTVTVVSGSFRTYPFTRNGSELNAGSYTVVINSLGTADQPPSVRDVLGKGGNKLTGANVIKTKNGSNIISYSFSFLLSSNSSPEKEKASQSNEKSSTVSNFFKRPNGNLEDFQMKGKLGVGIEISVANFGIGPTVEYWFTDNIAVEAFYSGLADWNAYGARGEYLINKPFSISKIKAKPYIGIGYSWIKGPSEDYGGVSSKIEGSGFDLHAGLLASVPYLPKNLMSRIEVNYSNADVKTTASAGDYTASSSSNFSNFGAGIGLYYFF